jgi:hypothetical protein
MPYPISAVSGGLPKRLLTGIAGLLIAVGAGAIDPAQDYSDYGAPPGHIFSNSALYLRDSSRKQGCSGIVRCTSNGDIVITVPRDVPGEYRVRFYDEQNLLLFEIRQIRDPLLIVEKYNFRRAGIFQYEVFRDSKLVEKKHFRINPRSRGSG